MVLQIHQIQLCLTTHLLNSSGYQRTYRSFSIAISLFVFVLIQLLCFCSEDALVYSMLPILLSLKRSLLNDYPYSIQLVLFFFAFNSLEF